MKLRTRIIVILILVLTSSCATEPEKSLSDSFVHPQQTREILKDGVNTIRGSAFIRRKEGGIDSCAGNTVYLFPATRDAIGQMLGIYILQSYFERTRLSRCNSHGRFKFDKVRDGNYLVAIPIYGVIDYSKQCGWLIRRITVEGGEVKSIVLNP